MGATYRRLLSRRLEVLGSLAAEKQNIEVGEPGPPRGGYRRGQPHHPLLRVVALSD